MLKQRVLTPEEKREADIFFADLEKKLAKKPKRPYRKNYVNPVKYSVPDFILHDKY